MQAAVRAGASDFVRKGFGRAELVHSLRNALARRRWRRMERRLLSAPPGFSLVGDAPALRKMKSELARVAPREIPVLIEGETGSGKEVAARALHQWGPDPAGPFVAVNCAAVPESTAESYFFGHEKGAFTGADRAREGVFEEAEGGTLFLDEINSLPLGLQGKLLRVLQEKEVRRMGGRAVRTVNFRLVAAANASLEAMVAEGRFREDLFYRVNAIAVRVPPLRERLEDLPALASYLLPERSLGPELLGIFSRHAWPGNVRELRNVLAAADALAEPGEALAPEHLPERALRAIAAGGGGTPDPAEAEEDFQAHRRSQEEREREFLERAYRSCGGNVSRLARTLSVDRSHLHQKLTRHGIHKPKG
jgi:DNA-binding NtrC family response regulator